MGHEPPASPPPPSLLQLPRELLLRCAARLLPADLARLCRCCRALHRGLFADDHLWRAMARHRFGPNAIQADDTRPAVRIYFELARPYVYANEMEIAHMGECWKLVDDSAAAPGVLHSVLVQRSGSAAFRLPAIDDPNHPPLPTLAKVITEGVPRGTYTPYFRLCFRVPGGLGNSISQLRFGATEVGQDVDAATAEDRPDDAEEEEVSAGLDELIDRLGLSAWTAPPGAVPLNRWLTFELPPLRVRGRHSGFGMVQLWVRDQTSNEWKRGVILDVSGLEKEVSVDNAAHETGTAGDGANRQGSVVRTVLGTMWGLARSLLPHA
ncbi:hypothetical protein HK405_000815 [Cladochytrium tenue]|nr:hypothetical protein HK405_000815 [Cladochytrium tenue]